MFRWLTTTLCLALLATFVAAAAPSAPVDTSAWDPVAAGRYLRDRVTFWQTWPSAQRDHGTACVSCHTVLPYAMARPALQKATGAPFATAGELQMFANITKRVTMWNQVEPFYPDQTRGIPKTSESRGTESVLNAFILSTRDAGSGTLADDTRQALQHMWALQMRTGPTAGGWTWLNFGLEPWEGPASTYFGASLAALTVARAPQGYAATPDIQPHLTALTHYLRVGATTQSLYNQLMILWASGALPGVLDADAQATIAEAALAHQNADGGWSMTALAPWTRVDNTPLDDTSDGFATAMVTVALLESGRPASSPAMQRARVWLATHQDRTSGAWPATSVNKRRDPSTEPARFMTDAATGLAVLALTHQ